MKDKELIFGWSFDLDHGCLLYETNFIFLCENCKDPTCHILIIEVDNKEVSKRPYCPLCYFVDTLLFEMGFNNYKKRLKHAVLHSV